MNGIMRLFLVPLAILTFTAAGFAQATPATPATPEKKAEEKKVDKKVEKKQRPKTTQFAGELVAADAEKGTLRVKGKDKEMSFTVDSKGSKKRLGRAKVGQQIRLRYHEKEGKLIATSLAGGLGGHEPAKAQEMKPEAKGMEKQEGTKAATK